MKAYRLTHKRYANDMSGFGAYKVGGRWNPKGFYALYLAEHPCGAILETLIHMPPQLVPDEYSLVCCQLSKHPQLKVVNEKTLPVSWRKKRYNLSAFQEFGKKHLFDKNLLGLYIPSAVAYPSHNIVLNPRHEDFASSVKILEIKPYIFDPRLLQLFDTAH